MDLFLFQLELQFARKRLFIGKNVSNKLTFTLFLFGGFNKNFDRKYFQLYFLN